jgi:hypothetical protein
VTFSSGKQARQFQELHVYLRRVVDANRASEVDPVAASYDTIEAALADAELSKLTRLALRPDVKAAASALSDLPKTIRRALEVVSQRLPEDESVLALTTGGYGSAIANVGAVLAVTDRCVLVVRESGVVEATVIERSQVEAVNWQQGVVGGRLDIAGAGRTFTLRALDLRATPKVVDLLTPRQTPEQATPDDTIARLERLAALRDSGALTPAEFDQQKSRILGI